MLPIVNQIRPFSKKGEHEGGLTLFQQICQRHHADTPPSGSMSEGQQLLLFTIDPVSLSDRSASPKRPHYSFLDLWHTLGSQKPSVPVMARLL